MTNCPYCQSAEILPCGFDEESAELWKCMKCGQIFMRADLFDTEDGQTGTMGISDADMGVNSDQSEDERLEIEKRLERAFDEAEQLFFGRYGMGNGDDGGG